MKNLKLIFSFFLLHIFLFSNAISQIIDQAEFMLVNRTADIGNAKDIKIDIYPIYSIYNGNKEYAFDAKYPISPPTNSKIWGIHNNIIPYQNQNYIKANFDYTSEIQNCDFSLGYGLYGIIFYEYIDNQWVWKYECSIDFSDANFTGYSQIDYFEKFRMDYYNNENIFVNFIDLNGNNTTPFNIWEGQYGNSVKVWDQVGTGNPQHTPSKDGFTDFSENSQYHSYPLDAYAPEYGFFRHDYPDRFMLNLNLSHHDAELISGKTLHFYSCFEIFDNINFTANNSCQEIYINGQGIGGQAKFKSGNGSMYLPDEFVIRIMNGASIESNGTSFVSKEPSTYWYGVYLSEPGISIINNCIFRNAAYAIKSVNNLEKDLSITDNEFYVGFPGISSTGIRIDNTNNVTILNNYFNMLNDNNYGLQINNSAYSEEENNSVDEYLINIVGNEFHYGMQQIGIYNLLNVFIKGNNFYDGLQNIYSTGSKGKIISNSVRNPIFDTWCISLINSDYDFLSNDIKSSFVNIDAQSESNLVLAPNQINDQIIWSGGFNSLEIYESNFQNILSTDGIPGFVHTDYGKNTFLINNSYQNFITAKINTQNTDYYSRNNCWYLNSGSVNPTNHVWLVNSTNGGMVFYYQGGPPYSECVEFNDQIIDRIITDRGNGIWDTVLITQTNNLPLPTEDITLFGTAVKNQQMNNASSAINNIKYLINNYPNSKYLEKSIFNLYECYVYSDTNNNQDWRNIIFGDLKSFLESKIQLYQNNEEFVNVAFNFLLKSKIKIKNYQQAMDGYDFIANNSPSATERLMASINYIDVEGLLQGSGSGTQGDGELSDELNSNQNGKPIKDILLASYNKTKEQIKQSEKNNLKNSSDIIATKEELSRKHTCEKKLEDRAKENISISGSLTKSERRERIQKDLMLLHNRDGYTSKKTKSEITAPIKYELSQNYPNPFNPITNIKYRIQKTGLVTLKIYDLLGREIKTLVNEIKNPGCYVVSFNGSEFASGVYFYRIQAGDFVQVKKMLMIK